MTRSLPFTGSFSEDNEDSKIPFMLILSFRNPTTGWSVPLGSFWFFLLNSPLVIYSLFTLSSHPINAPAVHTTHTHNSLSVLSCARSLCQYIFLTHQASLAIVPFWFGGSRNGWGFSLRTTWYSSITLSVMTWSIWWQHCQKIWRIFIFLTSFRYQVKLFPRGPLLLKPSPANRLSAVSLNRLGTKWDFLMCDKGFDSRSTSTHLPLQVTCNFAKKLRSLSLTQSSGFLNHFVARLRRWSGNVECCREMSELQSKLVHNKYVMKVIICWPTITFQLKKAK